jgi:hypothetical protein
MCACVYVYVCHCSFVNLLCMNACACMCFTVFEMTQMLSSQRLQPATAFHLEGVSVRLYARMRV